MPAAKSAAKPKTTAPKPPPRVEVHAPFSPPLVIYVRFLIIWGGFGVAGVCLLALLGKPVPWQLAIAVMLVMYGMAAGAMWARGQRKDEAWRLLHAIRAIADLPREPTRREWKVTGWDGLSPSSVMLKPGPKFNWSDRKALRRLSDEFASALNLPPSLVSVERLKRGWVALEANDEVPTFDDDAVPAARKVAADPLSITERIRDALAPIVDDKITLDVTRWHSDGAPAAIVLGYPSRAAHKARGVRGDLPTVMADVSAPRSQDGRWRFTWEPHRDRFLAVDETDPLAVITDPVPIEDEPNLSGLVIGSKETGEPWSVPILGNHIFIAGSSGSGKGSVLWGVIRGLMPLILDGRCLLYVSDPKGGMELGVIKPFAHRFALAHETAEMLAEAILDTEAQARRLAAAKMRKLEAPTRENPLRLVIVDEISSAVAYDKTNNEHLARLLAQGRAPGTVVIGALQDPRVKTLDVRSLFLTAIALRLAEPRQVDMVLGGGMRAAGATADLIPDTLQGVGFVTSDDMAGSIRVRAAFVTDDEIARLTDDETDTPADEILGVLDEDTEPVEFDTPRPSGTIKVKALKEGDWVALPGQDEPVTVVSSEPSDDGYYLVTYVPSWGTYEESELFEANSVATPA